MKRVYLLLMFWALTVCGASAQILNVHSVKASPMDISASKYERRDLVGNSCGLVKVQLAALGAVFEGNVIGEVAYKTGEYWVYMSGGSKQLRIKHPNFVPLTVEFQNYGINSIQPKATYEVTLVIPQIGQDVDDGMRYLVMTVNPQNAIVYIDDKLQQVTNGTVSNRLSVGTHTYRVEAVGFAPQVGTVQLTTGKKMLPITLTSVQASLNVVCPTDGAKIYINDNLRGTAPWQGQLTAGDYMVEARLQSYRSQRQNVRLTESENRTLNLPALIPITGKLDVNFQPVETEVWLDGKLLGTSPDIFRGILVGQHQVELRKAGYESRKETVNVEESQLATLVGSLSPISKATSTTSSSSNTSSASSAYSGSSSSSRMTMEYLLLHPAATLASNTSGDMNSAFSEIQSKHANWKVQKSNNYIKIDINGSKEEWKFDTGLSLQIGYSSSSGQIENYAYYFDGSEQSKIKQELEGLGLTVKSKNSTNITYNPWRNLKEVYLDFKNRWVWLRIMVDPSTLSTSYSSGSSSSAYSASSSPSGMTMEYLLMHPAATLASNTSGNMNSAFSEIRSKHANWKVQMSDNKIKIDINESREDWNFDTGLSLQIGYSSNGRVESYDYYFDGSELSKIKHELERLGLTVKEKSSTRITYNKWRNLKEVFVDYNNSWVWLRVWVD